MEEHTPVISSPNTSPVKAATVTALQREMVALWHEQEVNNPYFDFLATVCTQHSFNYKLWHEEDIARCPDSDDTVIARVKRSIDRLNQQRNDWIEKIDDQLTALLESAGVQPAENVRLNTETPGSVMDRLSIMSLRIYHLQEQVDREDASEEHRESVQRKMAVCMLQRDDLENSLQNLLDDIFAGRLRHRTYRQFKMYNDPALNPYLYKAGRKTAA
ncbi:MAG: DUF4254 domain-containing protein [Planctomycetota bacterium]